MKRRNKRKMEYDIAIIIPPRDQFDYIEIHPVTSYDNGKVACFEICKPEKAENWSVYLRQSGGGIFCIADCRDQHSAKSFADLLKIIIENWKRL